MDSKGTKTSSITTDTSEKATEEEAPTVITVKGKTKAASLSTESAVEPQVKEDTSEKSEVETQTTDQTPTPVSSFSLLDTKQASDQDESVTKTNEPTVTVQATNPVDTQAVTSDNKWMGGMDPTTPEPEKKSPFKVIALLGILVIVAGLIAGGIYYYQKNVVKDPKSQPSDVKISDNTAPSPVPTLAEITDKEDTADTDLKLADYDVSVLNGTGIPGEASKVKDLLVKAGFTTAKIKTGNADSYDYKTTTVSLKADLPAKLYTTIETAIKDTYKTEKAEDELGKNSSYDVIIIIGK